MDLVKQLEAAGYDVHVFNEYHLRVNDELDLFPNEKRRPIAWHDRFLNTRGRIQEDKIVAFCKERMNQQRTESATKESFMQTMTETCGWSKEEAEREWEARQCQQPAMKQDSQS